MALEKQESLGVMEGQGLYNRHGKLQASGGALALPLLEAAVRRIALDLVILDLEHQSLVIADYGSSQGENSLLPMQVAIRGMRRRIGPDRPISVVHIDQPANDFNMLFKVLETDPNRYAVGEPNVFSSAVGRSFYESVLPPCSVHLGWSSYAAQWLSRVPTLVPGHVFCFCSTEAVRAEFDRQSTRDWESFLSLRARELRPGGRLVVLLPLPKDDGSSGLESVMDHANAVLAEMVVDGALTTEERRRMVIHAHSRQKKDLLIPFAGDLRFGNLEVERCEAFEVADPAWIDYERDGSNHALGAKQALFFRSTFMPSLASALDRVRSEDAEALRSFADRLESRLKERLARQPVPIHTAALAIVLAKTL